MKFLRSHRWRLQDYVLLSWVGPGLLAIVASLMVFVLLGWFDYQNNKERIVSDLEQKSLVAARRVSAEILLGESGSLGPVMEFLNQNLSIKTIRIENESTICGTPAPDTCSSLSKGNVEFYRKTPHIDRSSFVVLGQPLKPLWSFLNLYLLLWSALPVFIALVTGLMLQRKFLRRFMIEPINSLVTAAERQTPIPNHWPIELKEIATSLAGSFEAREQAVFAMLAKGVIHDIKTFLHSLLIATELVREQQADAEKKIARLDSLYRACALNLPKMKRIIELTLDGSREIPIRPLPTELSHTIQGAIDANRDQAKLKDIKINFCAPKGGTIVPHDPVQLERALSNLIKNGIEAVSATDRKSNTDRQVRITVSDDSAGLVATSIEDTGSGINCDPECLFKPTKSKKAHGAGLGLYITEKIVRGHGGIIRAAQSEDLGGASFTLYLPKDSQIGERLT